MDRSPTHDPAADAELVARVRAGEREAFAGLVRRYQRMVYALALRMTGSQDEAEDVVQTTFLNAYRQIAGFRGDASFKTWLYGIALNECRMVHRRGRPTTDLAAVGEPAAPDDSIVDPVDRRRLDGLVARLPETQRAALLLRVCEDLSFREIAAALGTSEASAKVSYFHAVKKLRGWVAPPGGGAPEAGE